MLGNPGTHSGYELIEHLGGGGQLQEVLEGFLVPNSELHQKLVVEEELPSPADPWSLPDFTSSSSSSLFLLNLLS